MDLEKMVSPAIYSFIKNREKQPRNYEEFVPLVRAWIDTQQDAYSFDIPEKHAAVTETASPGAPSGGQQAGSSDGSQASSDPARNLRQQLRAQEGRLKKVLVDTVDALSQSLHFAGKGKTKGKPTSKSGKMTLTRTTQSQIIRREPSPTLAKSMLQKTGRRIHSSRNGIASI